MEGGGMLSELKRRKGPFWKRALEVASESWRRHAAARAAARATKPLPFVKVPRSRLEAAISARLAVRAGVRLDDFLRQRFARYATRLPVSLDDLPVVIDVENGEPVVRARPQPHTFVAAAAYAPTPQRGDEAARWMRSLVEREGPFAARQIREAEEELAALDARAAAARERAETLAHQLADDLAAGKVPAPPRVDATPEQLGRPPVPPLWPVAALRLFVLSLVVAVAWFFSGPILATQGLADADILEALRARPLPAGMSLALALGAAAAVFAFAHVALERAAALLGGDAHRTALVTLAAVAAAGLAAGVAAAATTPGPLALLALLVVVPFAGAVLLRGATALDAARAAALDAALAWDRALARDVAERARRTEIVDEARAALAQAELERAEARQHLHQLERRAVDAEHAASARTRADERRLDRLAESFAAALELDRYAFVRLASDAAHEALMRPMLRLEPAVAPERLGIAR
jgi:hypothetical protein